VQAARLAAAGVRGFQYPLEGKAGFFRLYANGDYDPEVLTEGQGSAFHGEQVSFKIWPSCRGTHAFIEAALALVGEHDLDPAQIDQVRLSAGPVQTMLMEPREQKLAPRSPINAKFSLPFTVGAALTKGRITLDDFTPEALSDPDTLAMAARVTYALKSGWGPERNASGVTELMLKDGRTLGMQVDHAKGSPHNPLSRSELIAKFKDCAQRARRPLEAMEADRWAKTVFALEDADDAPRAILG
jgi:2-methylcitrate dehydratase PrpD